LALFAHANEFIDQLSVNWWLSWRVHCNALVIYVVGDRPK
jgi:hypothetical protein